jgi:hypothetical protein
VKDDILRKANFLIDQEVLDVGSLISTQLDNFSHFQILLHGPVATEILFECFTYSLNVKVIGETGHSGDTLSSVSLLDANMDLLFRSRTFVSSVLKGVCATKRQRQPVSGNINKRR